MLSRRPQTALARRPVGRHTPGAWRREVDGSDVVINLAGPQRQLPLHAGTTGARFSTRGSARPASSAQAIASASAAAARLAPGEHGDDLRPSIRRAERRVRACSAATNRCAARHLAIQHRRRARVGARVRRSRDAAHAQGSAAVGDDDEPGSGRHLRHAARARSAAGSAARPATAGSSCPGSTTRTSSRRSEWLIAHEDIDGVVNVASPHPLPNAEFMRMLREACGHRSALPATRWMLGDRRGLHADRDGADPQEPPRRAGAAARERFRVRVSAVARGRARPLPAVEAGAAVLN